ncbi:hypothetical protein V1511DRAFT_451012, partial [Dipodascopsis uninucleata]
LDLFSINLLKIGFLGNEEFVVILTDAGQAILYSTVAVLRNPSVEPIYVLQMERSAWGADFHDQGRLLAVSDNSRCITLFKLGVDNKKARRHQQKHSRMNSEDSSIGYENNDFKRVISNAHNNNIPCVKFCDIKQGSSQKICILSTSIDGDCKLWDVATLRCISDAMFRDKKGWSCLALSTADFVNISGGFEEITGISEGRPSHLGKTLISYPVKSSNPFVRLLRRRWRRHGSDDGENQGQIPYEMYEEDIEPLYDFEVRIEHALSSRYQEESRLIGGLDDSFYSSESRMSSAGASQEPQPEEISVQERKKYNLEEISILHLSLYQSRLVSFCGEEKEARVANICPSVFGVRKPIEHFSASFDRLNMAISIRELSIVVVASQEGRVSIFRLCRAGDEIGLKQEKIIDECGIGHTNNVLLGIDVCAVATESPDMSRRYLLCLVHLDGTVGIYEIRR